MTLRRRDALHLRDKQIGPSMTPMVDVVLVILIFFMGSAVIGASEGLLSTGLAPEPDEVDAQAASDRAQDDGAFALRTPVIEVRLSAEGGTIVVEGFGAAGDLDRFETAATEATRGLDLTAVEALLSPDDDVPWEAVVRVRGVLEGLGVGTVALR